MPTAGKCGAVYCQTGAASVSFTNEAMIADAAKLRYTITNATKRFWDMDAPPTVKVDGTTVTSGYTVEYPGGVIVFTASQGAAVITVSGKYFVVAQVGGVFNWKLDVSMKDVDTTALGDDWESCISSIGSFAGSAEMYWGDGTFFSNLGKRMILRLFTDAGAALNRFEFYGMFLKDAIETPKDDVVKESIDFKGIGQPYYRAG